MLATPKAFSGAASNMKYLKATDTFLNRWPIQLPALGSLKSCSVAEYDKMFAGDTTTDRLDEAMLSSAAFVSCVSVALFSFRLCCLSPSKSE